MRVLKHLDIDYYLINGTLLGLCRDDCLIPWDNDIDICVDFDTVSVSDLIFQLKSIGFEGGVDKKRRPGKPILKFRRNGGRVVEIVFQDTIVASNGRLWVQQKWYKTSDPEIHSMLSKNASLALRICNKVYKRQCFKQLMMKNEESVHIYSPCMLWNRVVFLFLSWLEHKFDLANTFGYSYPAEYSSTKELYIYGGESAKIPSMADKICEIIYGKEWKIPVKSDHWTQFLQD